MLALSELRSKFSMTNQLIYESVSSLWLYAAASPLFVHNIFSIPFFLGL